MNKGSPFCVQYYNYRVEFQLRGAAHVHGTLWVHWDTYFDKVIKDETAGKESNDLNLNFENEKSLRIDQIKSIFEKIKDEQFGRGDMTDMDSTSDLNLLTNFVDHWISVSLKDPSTKQLAHDLNTHHCFKKSCLKTSEKCKYNFPRFPSLKSLIAIPAKIKYPENIEKMEKSIKKSKRN